MSGTGVWRPRQHDCHECPLRRHPTFRPFSAEELGFVNRFKKGELLAEPGDTLLNQGAASPYVYTVLSGWAYRYKTLADGRRQVLNFALPGDLIGVQGSMFGAVQHSVDALTPMRLCIFPRDELWTLYQQFPSLAFDVTWLCSREEMLLDEHLMSVGRRHAAERTAFLLLHLYLRAERVGLAAGDAIRFPFTQQLLADTLGLSLVHTNKMLRLLRQRRLLDWNGGDCRLLDRAGLARIAKFDIEESPIRPYL